MRLLRWLIIFGLASTVWLVASVQIVSVSCDSNKSAVWEFEIKKDMTYAQFLDMLSSTWCRDTWPPVPFSSYLKWREVDRHLIPGQYAVLPPHTPKRFADALARGSTKQETFTIIPGWDLRDIAKALVKSGRASSTEAVYREFGRPAEWGQPAYIPDSKLAEWVSGKPKNVSWEGYIAPETIAFADNATVTQIVVKFMEHQASLFSSQMLADIKAQGRTVHEILTMASLLEREVRSPEDKAIVADIFWKRHDAGMGLQADSTVHYVAGTEGSVFTTNEERQSNNAWNTYRHPQLPPGPIASPNKASIQAAIYPKANDYWYFLTTLDTGEVKYGRTLAEHNANVQKYLR